ncbi:hypothetical protein AURANDRAFT_64742 [Aureococcus anophagefferens]|uniref:Uncharacterized protein AOT2 n=1 Tax=Aureococcus anophagefferens TaxID=44056 RepID=F0YBA5_AURAN|nr:hypothetical protein AURANDRAFT_64742 [Aureococcus anophagefferens]EGB07723.1 hypothetical protein AURANDRAFT_64742 [Aureococcus anophagefferens]|eukprot:XP_009037710.1 hypothetical protein AURANDRAFT_64742 [Aureococcus anophagefferens]
MGDAFAALIAASSPGPGAMAALNALGGARRATIGALAVGALWPLCSLKSLAALAPTSALGTGGVLYTAGFMAKRCLDGTYAAGGRFAKECGVATFGDTLGFGSVNLGVYLAMCGTAYMAHFNAPSFFQDAGKKMKPYNAVIRNGFGLSILLNIAFMAAGFNTFGKGAKGLVLNNYATTDALAVVARALFGVSVVFTFPLAYNAVKTGLRGVARNMFAKTDAETLEKAVVGVPLALITAIALVVDDAGVVAALTGALMGSAVIYALPALMLLKGDKVAKAGWEKKIAPFAMLAMGAVGAVLGVSAGSGPRKKKQPRRETYAPNAPPPPQPKPVDADPGPEPGTRFVDEGKLWVVYRREGRRMVTKVVGTAKLRKVYKELDVVYYYAADAPRPSEENYLSECEYSGIGEVRDWIARTPPHFAAQPAPTAAAAAPAAHSRDAAAAAAAAARPRPAAKAPAAPAAKERPRPARRPAAQKAPAAPAAPSAPPPLRPCNGTVEATSASGICAVKWADGTTSDLLVADARRLGLAV